MKTELLGGKIGFLGGEKETQGVGREILGVKGLKPKVQINQSLYENFFCHTPNFLVCLQNYQHILYPLLK
jgi:hypothetical protein